MHRLILFNKPYGVLSQFTDRGSERAVLADFIPLQGVYPAGRLDRDSEGLLLLTDDGALQHWISHPKRKQPKTYWVQVEGTPGPEALEQLRQGVRLKDGLTRPAQVRLMDPPAIWDRDPPIRHRPSIPTQWLELTIREGRNRQVRRMSAAVGHPTLRLVRVAIGPWQLQGLAPGEYRVLSLTSALRREYGLPSPGPRCSRRPSSAKVQPHDLETPRDRGGRARTGGTLPPGGRGRGRSSDAQPARRPSRARRKPR